MIDPLFQFHQLNDEGVKKAVKIAEAFSNLIRDLGVQCPLRGREWAITCTKLEEACFFAKKAVAVIPENQLKEKS